MSGAEAAVAIAWIVCGTFLLWRLGAALLDREW